jgi:hypothetical protein
MPPPQTDDDRPEEAGQALTMWHVLLKRNIKTCNCLPRSSTIDPRETADNVVFTAAANSTTKLNGSSDSESILSATFVFSAHRVQPPTAFTQALPSSHHYRFQGCN